MKRLISHPAGHYRFLPGIAPYSCGVIADPGHEIVRVTLRIPEPWRRGFEQVDRFLRDQGRQRADFCAMELRSPRPFTMEGFIEFNRGYCAVLLERLPAAQRNGVCWHYTRPPVIGIEYEMDLHGVATQWQT